MPKDAKSQARDGRQVRVLVFAASLRSGSLNESLAALAAAVVQEHGAIAERAAMADFDCPSYNGDVERDTGVPAGGQRFRDRLVAADAFIIASPEYNASMPGCLKNAIDWVSRIRPQPFNGRQGMLLSASPSMAGGNRGLWSLRVPLEHLGARLYPDMFSLAQAHHAFDPAGRIAEPVLQQRFERNIECFLDLVEAAKHYRPLKKLWVEYLGEHPDATIDRVEHTTTEAES
jgi:chromate reductase, NAD(P)H dehydrogenase (quinone)